jgi:putative molybdenum carrier protein
LSEDIPRGRRAEDGKIQEHYHLTELSSISYEVRTRRNVREGDGTVVFSLDPILTGGSALTLEYATKVKKPRIHIHRSAADYSDEAFSQEVGRLKDFIESNRIAILNVAGPRESNQPGVYAFSLKMLRGYWENR